MISFPNKSTSFGRLGFDLYLFTHLSLWAHSIHLSILFCFSAPSFVAQLPAPAHLSLSFVFLTLFQWISEKFKLFQTYKKLIRHYKNVHPRTQLYSKLNFQQESQIYLVTCKHIYVPTCNNWVNQTTWDPLHFICTTIKFISFTPIISSIIKLELINIQLKFVIYTCF